MSLNRLPPTLRLTVETGSSPGSASRAMASQRRTEISCTGGVVVLLAATDDERRGALDQLKRYADRDSRLIRRPPMTAEELRRLDSSPLVESGLTR